MVVRVTSAALGSLALSRFRPFPAAWTSGPALTAVPLRVFENYWSHSCETPWRPFLVPVKKVEISERESIQEFFRESKRQILEEACLVFSGQLHHLRFFLVFGREVGQDRIPTLLLSPKAAQLVARPPGGTQYGKITGSRTKRLRYSSLLLVAG